MVSITLLGAALHHMLHPRAVETRFDYNQHQKDRLDEFLTAPGPKNRFGNVFGCSCPQGPFQKRSLTIPALPNSLWKGI